MAAWTGRTDVAEHNGLDPVEFGRMQATLESVKEQLDALEQDLPKLLEKIDGLNKRIAALESLKSNGKFGLFGLAIGVMFALYGLRDALGILAKKIGL